MALIRGLHNIRPHHHGCALTIGNFDGVHLGHRAVLSQLSEFCTDLPSTLLTFEPHPREFFASGNKPHRLTPMPEKLRRLQRCGLDNMIVARFDHRLAALDAKTFVSDVLAKQLGVKVLIVGDDFRFGKGGQGDFALLTALSEQYGFEVHRQRSHMLEDRRISSTWVRECLAAGDIAKANVLLGDPYCIQGRVAYGRQLGRTVGFPTANINLTRHPPPISGVFAVFVHGIGGAPRPGVANLGRRPTVGGEGVTLETHLFDFDGNLYGTRIRVELVERLRTEKKFDSFDLLVKRIAMDADAARQCLAGVS